MNHLQILNQICNTPLAILPEKLSIINNDIVLKLLEGQELAKDVTLDSQNNNIESSGLPIINVIGSLSSRKHPFSSGGTSYNEIVQDTLAHINNGAEKLIYYFDSPGGGVNGLFGTTSFLKGIKQKYGVETIGYTDGVSASASYALMSAMDRVYSNDSSVLASIGVVMSRVDYSKINDKAGIKIKVYRSKEEKALGHPDEPITDKEEEAIIARLKEYDTIFNNTVVENRPNVVLQDIIDLKGNTVLGKDAIKYHLVDGIVPSFQDLLEQESLKSIKPKSKTTYSIGKPMTLEEAKAQIATLEAKLAELTATIPAKVDQARTEEKTRILTIMKAGTEFNVSSDFTTKLIVKDYTVAQATDMVEEFKGKTQPNIDTTTQTAGIDKTKTELSVQAMIDEALGKMTTEGAK